MPCHIDDDETSELIAVLAARLQTSEQDAVKSAVQAELRKLDAPPSFREKVEAFRARHPRPSPAAQSADKSFFDELSGEAD